MIPLAGSVFWSARIGFVVAPGGSSGIPAPSGSWHDSNFHRVHEARVEERAKEGATTVEPDVPTRLGLQRRDDVAGIVVDDAHTRYIWPAEGSARTRRRRDQAWPRGPLAQSAPHMSCAPSPPCRTPCRWRQSRIARSMTIQSNSPLGPAMNPSRLTATPYRSRSAHWPGLPQCRAPTARGVQCCVEAANRVCGNRRNRQHGRDPAAQIPAYHDHPFCMFPFSPPSSNSSLTTMRWRYFMLL